MRKIVFLLLVVVLVIQFFKPEQKTQEGIQSNNIGRIYATSVSVNGILKKEWYDCHSHKTSYSWYNNIQPIICWLNGYIMQEKDELNFNEFAAYGVSTQHHNLEEIIGEVKGGEMPLNSYSGIPPKVKLNDTEKILLAAWAASMIDTVWLENRIADT